LSLVEQINYIRKILGRLPQSEFSQYDKPLDRLMDLLSAPDHAFKPEVTVDENGKVLEISGFLYSIKADNSAVKVNFDRPVTDEEYTVVYPGMIKKVSRITSKLYLKALPGQTSTVTVEVLRFG